MSRKTTKEPVLTCPECGNENVMVSSVQQFNVNTGEFWCEVVKPHDPDSEATCNECGWVGRRDQLTLSK